MLRYIHIKPKTLDKKKKYFTNETFASKFLLKLSAPYLDPMIICLQILKYRSQNRTKTDIENCLPYLRTLGIFYKFICMEEEPSNVDNILRELAWVLFFQFCKQYHIIKRKGEKLDWFYIIFDGTVTVLDFVFANFCLTEKEYLVHLLKLEMLNEKEMIRQIKLVNHEIFEVNEKSIEEFCNKRKEQYDYNEIRKIAIDQLFKYRVYDLEKIKKFTSSIDNYIGMTNVQMNLQLKESSKSHQGIKHYFLLPQYKIVNVRDKTNFFGDLSTSKNTNDNFTYITNEQCDIGYINKREFYQSPLFGHIKRKMQMLFKELQNNFYIFQMLNSTIFLNYYAPLMKFQQYKKGDKLFIQNSLYKGVFLINEGEFDITTSRTFDEINSLMVSLKSSMDKFGEYISNLGTEKIEFEDMRKTMHDPVFQSNNFLQSSKERRVIPIITMKSRDIIGMNEYYHSVNNLYHFTCECKSDIATVFYLSKEDFTNVISKEPSVKARVSQLIESKVTYFIHTLKKYKENFLKEIGAKLNHFPKIKLTKGAYSFKNVSYFNKGYLLNAQKPINTFYETSFSKKRKVSSSNELLLFSSNNSIQFYTEENENKMLFNNRRDIERKAQSPVVIKNKTFRVNQTVRDKEKLSVHSSTPSLSEKKLIGSNLSKSQSKIKLKKINISHKKCLSSVNSMNKFQI